ncbi:MAG: Hsp70 family protein [Gammaproteobacteria bacterium]
MSEAVRTPHAVVGIDLGTTHCVMAWQVYGVESHDQPETAGVLSVPQLVAGGTVECRDQLPSFMYFPSELEFAEGELTLPWSGSASNASSVIVGELARRLGVKTPGRWLSSAKSWLCHGGEDRQAPILPVEPLEGVTCISPVAASQAYLEHLSAAWSHAYPEHPLAEQQVVVTIPASFDPVARELTAQAVQAAGMTSVTLLEEPQAALYAWLLTHPDWRDHVAVGDTLLVVDVGGGTTDLSLIQVNDEAGQLVLERVAVGNHILLGGDNMDLALAYSIKQTLESEGKRLERWQLVALTQSCREAKELLLSDSTLDTVPVTVPGRGSKLLGNTLRAVLTRDVLNQVLLEGFLSPCAITDRPRQAVRGALVEKGLPYAQDASITRHIAHFLTQQARESDENGFIVPQKILLNGGVFKSPLLTDRLVSVIQSWLDPLGVSVTVLDGVDLDLAVARGAAYYGQVAAGCGVRIRSGLASTYYVGVESAMPAIPGFEPPLHAVCVAPFGLETGETASLDSQEFHLVVGEAAQFRFFGSTVRKTDALGQVLEMWKDGELVELPTIEVNLTAEHFAVGEAVPVRLSASLSEIGTLEIQAIARGDAERWKVALEVRDQTR